MGSGFSSLGVFAFLVVAFDLPPIRLSLGYDIYSSRCSVIFTRLVYKNLSVLMNKNRCLSFTIITYPAVYPRLYTYTFIQSLFCAMSGVWKRNILICVPLVYGMLCVTHFW